MRGGPADKAELLHELIESEHSIVTHDAMTALVWATFGRTGNRGDWRYRVHRVRLQRARGETARAGGWGYLFGDEGGAFDIVLASSLARSCASTKAGAQGQL